MYGWDSNGQVIPLKSSYEVERTSEGGDQGYNGIDDWNYVSGMGDWINAMDGLLQLQNSLKELIIMSLPTKWLF